MGTRRGSNSTSKDVLYDDFLMKNFPEEFNIERPRSWNPFASPDSTGDSSRGKVGESEGDSAVSLRLQEEKEQENFLEKIYEPAERSKVHGFDYDEKSLKMMLLNERSRDSFKLIGVVGVLGVGKSTLCRLILNEEEVKQRFVPRIWIPMPEESKSMEEVVRRMLEQLGVEEKIINSVPNGHKLPGLLYALHLRLKGKRFLVVLDDVHGGNECNYYKNLVSCLSSGHGFPKNYGGAVIMTSRNEEAIKKMVGDQNMHRLLPLSDPDSCWAIYQNLDVDDVKLKAADEDNRKAADEEAKKSEGQVRPQDPGPSAPTEDRAKKTERQESGVDGSKEGKPESKISDVSKEVKDELKRKCGGFPLVARMMREIKQIQLEEENKSKYAAASINQASTASN
ncbi:hypothetical protein PTKIN_Ptkin05aG0005500 [Pterospermum kingtungense]